MVLDINNVNIRDGINNIIKFIIDQVLEKAFAIRAYETGWSTTEYYQSLPLAQRIWLDDTHLEQRATDDAWLTQVGERFASWVVQSYEISLKHSGSKILSTAELSHIRQFIDEAISQDKEFF
jgi:CRISPR-associated protein Csy1